MHQIFKIFTYALSRHYLSSSKNLIFLRNNLKYLIVSVSNGVVKLANSIWKFPKTKDRVPYRIFPRWQITEPSIGVTLRPSMLSIPI